MTETRLAEILETAFAETVGFSGVSLDDPQWDKAGHVHDWRNYVPEEVMAVWDTLPRAARIAVYLTAVEGASAEEWE